MAKINDASVRLYSSLEAETGHPTGWKRVGTLYVARTEDRMVQFRRTAGMGEYLGIQVDIIDSKAVHEKWPLMRIDDLRGGAWLADDGKVIPKETAIALATGARQRSTTIVEGVRVSNIVHRKRRAIGVATDLGPVSADYVVICGGMWTRELALCAGVNLPLYPVEHHYAVSNPIDGAFDELPCARDPDAAIYFRGEGNAVLLGAFQKLSKPWMVDHIPADFKFQLLDSDWKRFAQPLAAGTTSYPRAAGQWLRAIRQWSGELHS